MSSSTDLGALSPTDLIDRLNAEYEALHTSKEDAFWASMMGLGDAPAARALRQETEVAWNRFLQDPSRLAAVEAALASLGDDAPEDLTTTLGGWATTLRAHALASSEARALSEEIVQAEADLATARGAMNLGYEHPTKGFVESNSVALGVLVKNDPDEGTRRAALYGLRSIEDHVLANGFLDLVRQRNALARLHGFDDYYSWKVERTEQLTIDQIFGLLDDLEEKTRDSARRFVDEFKAEHGADSATPWNIHYHSVGDVVAEQDPYFSFADSVDRWGRSFAAMGIKYRGAELVLDLVQRRGKYENGFMHGPEIAWTPGASDFKPARIHFTSNAIPGMVGSGQRATRTLFHEGGHAAHFSNIDMPAPCFGQEFAPTSAAFCETQSMFLDSLLRDADWLVRYARDGEGNPMPLELIEKGVRLSQPIAAWEKRAMLAICYGERAIYALGDDELTAENVLATLREIEQRMLFTDEGSVRPVLSVPHLLAGESSAYYHAYLLAQMAVEQTRHFFLERDGHLVDNPRIGPDLTAAYWKPGNSRPFFDYVQALTGNPLSADAFAAALSMTADEAVAQAQAAVAREPDLPRFDGPIELDAHIRIAHGDEVVAELDRDWDSFAGAFKGWIRTLGTAALALAALVLAAPSDAQAQYIYDVVAPITYDFLSIDGSGSVSGTMLTLTDDGTADVTLPFNFTFWDNTYGDIRVGTNGAISFDLTAGLGIPGINWEPYDLEGDSALDIAALWDDLALGSGGVFTYWDMAANRFIVSWENVLRAGGATGTASFQVHLYADHRIQIHFADTDFGDPAYDFGASATTAIQDQTGVMPDNYLTWGYNSPYVTDGTGIQFNDCVDADGDGTFDTACGGLDCDDTDPSIYPGGSEFCNGVDDDCDGVLPPTEADADGDGTPECDGDCDDSDAAVNPGAPEVCDGLDNNCSGSATFGGIPEVDGDSDGFFNCLDCDDTNADIFPGAQETCDGIDEDCDNVGNDETADTDGDGFAICDGDCDDDDPTVSPGLPEICNGGIDDDCDPASDETVDDDGDGQSDCDGDCDDTNAATQPGATEICDGEDNDCDEALPVDEQDLDSDGQLACGADCDDEDPDTYQGAPELCDGFDNDCDGDNKGEDLDSDGDGQTPCDGDCDDTDELVFDGADEECDGIDNNCDGNVGVGEVDEDSDGVFICEGDCNDNNANIVPGAAEDCFNGIDDDCDGLPDAQDDECDESVADDDDDSAGDDDDDDSTNTGVGTVDTGCNCGSSVVGASSGTSVLALLLLGGLLRRRRV